MHAEPSVLVWRIEAWSNYLSERTITDSDRRWTNDEWLRSHPPPGLFSLRSSGARGFLHGREQTRHQQCHVGFIRKVPPREHNDQVLLGKNHQGLAAQAKRLPAIFPAHRVQPPIKPVVEPSRIHRIWHGNVWCKRSFHPI